MSYTHGAIVQRFEWVVSVVEGTALVAPSINQLHISIHINSSKQYKLTLYDNINSILSNLTNNYTYHTYHTSF